MMAPAEPDRPPDELILQQLGSAVLLCWKELPLSSQRTILNQADDMIGTTRSPEIRSEIRALLLRHGKA